MKKTLALATGLALAFASTGALAQAAHDHDHAQPAPSQPAPTPPAPDKHDHATPPQGGSTGGLSAMGGGMGGMSHMTMMEPTAANPFPHVEMKMHMAMMHATGTDATETYVRKMIEHHRGAVGMSQMMLANKPDRSVSKLATQSISDQNREIDALQAWLHQNGKSAQ